MLKTVELNTNQIVSILGLKWLPVEDTLAVKIDFDLDKIEIDTATRRSILSLISKIFDPLGVLAPVTIAGKTLMQEIWKKELAWDDVVPSHIRSKFKGYLTSLASLKPYRLKRNYANDYLHCKKQLIGFSDARGA